ncbi:hypothetical protein THRCLA_22747 [Thraustotheca clavata]|uniref:Uncharacterized protein n=1 Tax=Thraustotheca clavata TaxID=74557 RepID=A0A1V9YTI2_9STRA|nr:hypothetical protein THRCLA_22747 [Thraustotheca clavata]
MTDQWKKLAATCKFTSLKSFRNALLIGVEEQFYIFWPMFMQLTTKMPFHQAVKAQVVVAGLSFLLYLAFLGFGDTNIGKI